MCVALSRNLIGCLVESETTGKCKHMAIVSTKYLTFCPKHPHIHMYQILKKFQFRDVIYTSLRNYIRVISIRGTCNWSLNAFIVFSGTMHADQS